jgi:hypothetical protein
MEQWFMADWRACEPLLNSRNSYCTLSTAFGVQFRRQDSISILEWRKPYTSTLPVLSPNEFS